MKQTNQPSILRTAMNIGRKVFGANQGRYTLKFNKEKDNHWYIDFPGWPFAHHNLMMVSGADDLCEYFSTIQADRHKTAAVDVIPSDKEGEHPGYAKLVQRSSSLTGGSVYRVTGLKDFQRDIWLCPVTLFVLGEYPKYIYLKKAEE